MSNLIIDIEIVHKMSKLGLYRHLIKYLRRYPSNKRQPLLVETKESKFALLAKNQVLGGIRGWRRTLWCRLNSRRPGWGSVTSWCTWRRGMSSNSSIRRFRLFMTLWTRGMKILCTSNSDEGLEMDWRVWGHLEWARCAWWEFSLIYVFGQFLFILTLPEPLLRFS